MEFNKSRSTKRDRTREHLIMHSKSKFQIKLFTINFQCCKIKPEDPLLWLADWLLKNNLNKPRSKE